MSEPTLRAVDEEAEPDKSLSVLGQLKARRQEIANEQHLDLQVPRWESPAIVVRYKPIDHKVIKGANAQVDKAAADKKAEIEVNVNADILIRACVGVFAVVGGQRFSLRPGEPDGEWTKFDADLAENLGCGHTAREVVKALYITEGDLLSTANRIAEFSGYKEQEADDTLVGE